MYQIDVPDLDEFPQLLSIWESSVRATHHFLKEGHIELLKSLIQEKGLFNFVHLTCIRDEANAILGFAGVLDGNLEMLFVHPDKIGKGIGKILMLHAINELHVTKVDVNEQNEQALEFYRKFGFLAVSRSELDTQGNPYPILHMKLQ